MALIAKLGTAAIVSGGIPLNTPTASSLHEHSYQLAGQTAGAAIAPWDRVVLKSDGKWYPHLSGGSGMTGLKGWAPASAISAGDKDVTIYFGARTVAYTAPGTLTPGVPLYPSAATAGGLDATQSNSDPAVAYACADGGRIRTVPG